MDLSRLLSPQSIAVIGGGSWARNVVRNARHIGFEGMIWNVHPQMKAMDGAVVVPTIADLPQAPDAVYIAVNRLATIEAVRELAKIGAGGAICLASGFAEAAAEDSGSLGLQDELILAAGQMPVLGPNCYGLINYLDGVALWPDQHGGTVGHAGVAFLSQSSNIAINITMQSLGLPVSHVFTVGNQAVVDIAQLALAVIENTSVRAVAIYIEGIKNARAFEALARRSDALRKPVIILKAGKSERARSATTSHTASLAGDHALARAFFARLGFITVSNLEELVEASKLAFVHGFLPAPSVISMSSSGGEAALMADIGADFGVEFPTLSREDIAKLRPILGPLVALANPLDYHTYIWHNAEKLHEMFQAVGQAADGIALLVLDYPRADRCDNADWDVVENALILANAAGDVRLGVVASLAGNLPEARALRLIKQGIVPFSGMRATLAAISANAQRRYDAVPIAGLVATSKREVLSERAAKAKLRQFGIATPHGVGAARSDLPSAIGELRYPLVLKGEGFAHKTEANAVVLALGDLPAVVSAAQNMSTDQFLIEEMVEGARFELLVGISYDDAIGYALTLGVGGLLAEQLSGQQHLILPCDAGMISHALDQLPIVSLLNGYRGQRAVDRQPIIDAVLALQELVLHHQGQIAEAEINPLMVGIDFAIAADALILGDFP